VAGACAAATEDPRTPPLQTVMRDRVTRQPRGFGFVTFESTDAADAASAQPHWLDGNRVRRGGGGRRARGWGSRMRGACAARPGVSGGPLQPPKRHKQTNKTPHRFQIDAKRSVPHDARPRSKKVFVGGLAPDTGTGESRGRGAGPREGGARAAADAPRAPLRPSPDEFTSYFGQFGVVTDAQIMVDHSTGRSRGFG